MVRNSTIKDYLLVDKLQKENSYAVGFIQKTIWEDYVWGGKRNFSVFICEKNADPVGYVLVTPAMGQNTYSKIQQICIRNDARRLEYGSALLEVCRDFCEVVGSNGVSLRCRIDLESNMFWGSLGFSNYGTWEKGKINHVGFKASNDINLWRKEMNRNFVSIFDLLKDAKKQLTE